MRTLKKPYHQVIAKEHIAYGGNQAWFPYRFLRKTGCGVISAADVLLHLKGIEAMSEENYMTFAKELWMKYLPVIPGFGMNGLTLMIGMNRFFIEHKMPYFAYWKISLGKIITKIDKMLEQDIPIILAVGPNFPKFWGKEKLTFYVRNEQGQFSAGTKINAHFVTVTGREGAYLQISSWGKEYYINIREYKAYIRRFSSPLVSNIICIGNRKKIK